MITDDEIREIWDRLQNQTILSRAMGPDPMLFAHRIIEKYEANCKQLTVNLPKNS